MALELPVTGVVDAVVGELRRAVFAGELVAGQIVTEASVAGLYNVARPSAKAAIEKLVAEGILQRTVHRSARVRMLDADSVRDIYQTRRRIESEALRQLATERIAPSDALDANQEITALTEGAAAEVVEPDLRFHRAIVDAIGSERTSRAYASLISEVHLCMAQVQGRRLLSLATIAGEHARILELLAAGDGETAVAVLAEHLNRAQDRLVDALT